VSEKTVTTSAARSTIKADVHETTRKLLAYCRRSDWAGYDPYDALNSRLFKALPFVNSKIPRLALTQILKRSPINVRHLALVPKTQNPKAMALFLRALLLLPDSMMAAGEDSRKDLIGYLIDRLVALRSPGVAFWAWGYSFPWQGRSILVPAGAPNLVCTIFVANALLDAFAHERDGSSLSESRSTETSLNENCLTRNCLTQNCRTEKCLTMAVGAAEYILSELYWAEGEKAGFSYPMPGLRGETHNANLLAAALFCRVYQLTGEKKFLEPALRVARQAVGKQHADGSWLYGEHPSQRWIDNFHTGYNLEALHSIGQSLATEEFDGNIRCGFEFYRAHFFGKDAAPKYFHDRTYPIDIHCVAQSILTLLEFRDLDSGNIELANSVFHWAMKNMWDERGFFYYRVLRFCTIRTSYMRWSQAWMLLALSSLVTESAVKAKPQAAESPKTLAGVMVSA
jgi:N-acylglucosamine 2-epimerase (GlcNAc 2-epimerase)